MRRRRPGELPAFAAYFSFASTGCRGQTAPPRDDMALLNDLLCTGVSSAATLSYPHFARQETRAAAPPCQAQSPKTGP